MLSVVDPRRRYGRREFLRLGGAGMGALALGPAGQALASLPPRVVSDKAVIFLFLHGGPSQFETFDPKLTAPAEIRSVTGEIATAIPGVTFGSGFPRLAGLADRLTIVRSFTTGDANHDIKPVVGRVTRGANLGSCYARVAGATRPDSGLPANVLLVPRAVDPSAQPHQTQFGLFDSPGSLGPGFAPWMPGSGGEFQQSLELRLSTERLGDRRAILTALDRARWSLQSLGRAGALDPLREQAFQTLLGGQVARAFDWTQEDPRTIARYDTAPLVRPEQIDSKWNNYPFYVDNAKTLGKLLLLARRLCEAGCGFVTVTTNFVWDMHADVNNAPMAEGMGYLAPPLDYALSALVEDLHQRGLDDRVLVVACGEMGRTPRLNAGGGRDHWGSLAPLLLAGGGYAMGRVIGQSTRDGGAPAGEPIEQRHLIASILQTLLDPAALRLVPGVPAELVAAATDDPIPGLG